MKYEYTFKKACDTCFINAPILIARPGLHVCKTTAEVPSEVVQVAWKSDEEPCRGVHFQWKMKYSRSLYMPLNGWLVKYVFITEV